MNAYLVAMVLTLPPGMHSAPVYTYDGPTILQRTGTLLYKTEDPDYKILFCISTPPRIMVNCVVHTPSDKMLLIEVLASERST